MAIHVIKIATIENYTRTSSLSQLNIACLNVCKYWIIHVMPTETQMAYLYRKKTVCRGRESSSI